MGGFRDFLQDRIALGVTSTEDVLASFLPLMRQVLEAHQRNLVAPLRSVDHLHVEGVRLWYEESLNRSPSSKRDKVERLEKPQGRGLEILDETKRTLEVGGIDHIQDLSVGRPGDKITRPVYLPEFRNWEQEVGHHDPLTDIFSLGLLLASLACLLDFQEPAALKLFVTHRRNLFRLVPDLHPVLAKAILRMTDLRRHTRAPDLASLLKHLENYRNQEVDFDFDLLQSELTGETLPSKRHKVLEKLQERLFEISKRNRLLHYRSTMNTVNLTQASVPLSFDVRSIRPNQILTWGHAFEKDILASRPVALNKYLNFNEALYLPTVLDRIRNESRRDQAEFGFSQLFLVLCFLRWSNLKEANPESFNTPLLLLPVQLARKKGIRDTYWLKATNPDAEVNPVLRYYLKQLYDMELPERIDLTETSMDDLHQLLTELTQASEPAVNLTKVDRPRIDLVHDRARRRLDRYRRLRLSGRGVRTWMDVDYSYDPANFQPLGLQLFRRLLVPSSTHLKAILEKSPPPRRYFSPKAEEKVAVKEKLFFSVREEADDNPYNWELDLCNVSLGNFKYQKMTLVRDYRALLEQEPNNPAFDAIFSLKPETREAPETPTATHTERYQVVPCDPTQGDAIDLARAGKSYIIQGPPGTGKSQTITNLIADFVGRGQRVLFVCEKRAAIDVVFHRLQQQNLHPLCCLIHDALADKKEFVMDLKRTYEGLRLDATSRGPDWEKRRDRIHRAMDQELIPLKRFQTTMLSQPETAGVEARELLERAVETAHQVPILDAVRKEALPDYATWHQSRESLHNLTTTLSHLGIEILARNPLGRLAPEIGLLDHPVERVTQALAQAIPLLDLIEEATENADLPGSVSLNELETVFSYCGRIAELGERKLLPLLDQHSELSSNFEREREALLLAEVEHDRSVDENIHWKDKLPPGEVNLAIERILHFEKSSFNFFSRDWWQLRRVLNQRYDFGAHSIRPHWRHVLERLQHYYQAVEALQSAGNTFRQRFHIPPGSEDKIVQFIDSVIELRESSDRLGGLAGELHRNLLAHHIEAHTLLDLAEAGLALTQLREILSEVLADFRDYDLRTLSEILTQIEGAVEFLPDFVHCLAEIEGLPSTVARALRSLPLPPETIEAAIIAATLEGIYRQNQGMGQFNGIRRRQHSIRLQALDDELQATNAAVVRDRVRRRFLEHLKIASTPAAQLTAKQKEFKNVYNKGRRELEHEFGKSMRYKSIRDLVSGDSGILIRDLKPVWLMSPLSVSDTLSLDADFFDVVIFDEASQVTLEEAVPSVARAPQVIVVGDEMQLPPTNFFSARRQQCEEKVWIEEEGELFEYDLESNSFLNHVTRSLPSKMLGWHYRSRFESLISFSNWAFYQGGLLTVPERRRSLLKAEEIRATGAEDGAANLETTLARPVSFHLMTHGVYERRKNRAEAEYIAEFVRALLLREGDDRPSLGIVSFSMAQQEEIDQALERLADHDREFRDRLEAEREREEDDQFVGLLVKNLENIQGDERDIVIMSVCYGFGPDGRMRMNFGPINQSGGEKRLNVAFSRAKRNMVLVSSIQHQDIKNDYNDGANCLKNYLRYAAASSVGHEEGVQRVLTELALWRHDARLVENDDAHPVVSQLASALEERGFTVTRNLGQSRFRCDLAIAPGPEADLELAIFVDHENYYRQANIMERDVLRPKLLQAFGWKTALVLAKDWLEEPSSILDRLTKQMAGEEDLFDYEVSLDEEELEGDEEAPEKSKEESVRPEQGTFPSADSKESDENQPLNQVAAASWTRYFELVGGRSRKFWEITLASNQYSVRFGRLGTEGQERTKSHASPELAEERAIKIIAQKKAKGYEEKPSS